MDTGDIRGCDGMLRTRGWADFLRWLWGTCSLSAGTMRIGARRHRGCARAKLCCARMHEPSSLPQPLIQPRGGSVHCTCPARVGNEFSPDSAAAPRGCFGRYPVEHRRDNNANERVAVTLILLSDAISTSGSSSTSHVYMGSQHMTWTRRPGVRQLCYGTRSKTHSHSRPERGANACFCPG